ncbi:hypothetical protein EVAR_16053_1 [Eumeta japonica]|uniref:Uncharacterized protein n=1 Tax=Eumeta variegata TaxID=151549 RepID=A0A4C1VWT5_EUMVA|nr:hypothetical protein EVAR_16053_1 [Eumeta japonica]
MLYNMHKLFRHLHKSCPSRVITFLTRLRPVKYGFADRGHISSMHRRVVSSVSKSYTRELKAITEPAGIVYVVITSDLILAFARVSQATTNVYRLEDAAADIDCYC